MTNKQTQATAVPEEKPSVELLRRRFKLSDEFIESIRQDNVNAGVDSSYDFVQWRGSEFMERREVENFISKVTDKKRPGHFWQISDLKARGLIPKEETSEYENITYPYRKLNCLFKIKLAGDGRLVLMRFETWFGLDLNGQEVHRSFDFIDYYSKPRIEYDRVPVNPQDGTEGQTARVKIVRNPDNHENNLLKEWITPYSREKVDEFLKYAAGPLNEPNGTALCLKKEGVTNEVSATYEQFIAEDFDGTFERIRTPTPDFKEFLGDLKKKAKQTAEDDNGSNPYA